MNKIVKISLIILGIIVFISGFIYAKNFIIGSKSYESIVISKVVTSNDNIIITGEITDSARSYKSANFTQVGTELYVTITSVITSKKYSTGSFEINIPINGIEINNIHLSDGKTTKVIYSK